MREACRIANGEGGDSEREKGGEGIEAGLLVEGRGAREMISGQMDCVGKEGWVVGEVGKVLQRCLS